MNFADGGNICRKQAAKVCVCFSKHSLTAQAHDFYLISNPSSDHIEAVPHARLPVAVYIVHGALVAFEPHGKTLENI